MIFILILNICPSGGLTLSWVWYLLRNKKWKQTRSGNFSSNWVHPKAPVLCISVSHEFTRVRVERRTSSVSRSSQTLTSNYSPEITCTSWPIWEQGLAHCSSPKQSLGAKTTSPLGLIYRGYSQLTSLETQWFQLLLFAPGEDHHPFSPPTAIFPVTSVTWNFKSITYHSMKKHDAEQLENILPFM